MKFLTFILLIIVFSSCSFLNRFQPKKKLIGTKNVSKLYEFDSNIADSVLVKRIKLKTRSKGWTKHPHNTIIHKQTVKEFKDGMCIKRTKTISRRSQKRWSEELKKKVASKKNNKWYKEKWKKSRKW